MITEHDIRNNKIVLGISGGVDSTTAALLLLEKGYDVYGMYFNIHEGDAGERDEALAALKEAYAAASIRYSDEKFIYIDVSQEFKDIVISDFCREYKLGHTPNPCVVCNPNIKFRFLCEAADKVGAYHIATGHYADTAFVSDCGTDASGGAYYIKAAASKKDQSYMLYRLPQKVISRLIFPLAEFEAKDDVRNIARKNDFSSAEKSDSQEICFIADDADYVDFIKDFDGEGGGSDGIEEGSFIDNDGKVLGRHKGLAHYTIGQRKGLGIALGHPVFITDIDCENNTVTLGENEELFKSSVLVGDLFFTETGGATLPSEIHKKNLTAKVRYAAPRATVKVTEYNSSTMTLIFDTPQRAMTPGQSLVIYDGDLVIGGGRIIKAL